MSAGASTANATIYQFLGIQSGPNNQTIYSVVYVSSGPMNFTGNNFVFTTITSGAGNTSIVYSGATAGAGNTTLIGSGVVASGPQNWTIPVNPMNGGPYNSVFSQLPIAYKTGASMQGLINTHIIFYGAASRNYFTSANKAIVQNFLANVYGTSWYAVAMKYGVGRVILGQSVFVDCQSSSGYGCAITTANVQALVWSQIGSPLPADSSAFYLVVTAPEVIEAQDPTSSTSPSLGQSYCGYHNFIYSNVFDTFKYAVVGVPNISPISMTGIVTAGSIPSMTKPASKCIYAINPSSASPNGDAQVDMAITTIAHELIEAIISPVAIQTWSDANNLEGKNESGGRKVQARL